MKKDPPVPPPCRNVLYGGCLIPILVVVISVISLLVFGCVKVEEDTVKNSSSARIPDNEHFVKYENGVLTTRITCPQIPATFRVYQVVGSGLKFQIQFVGNK